MKLVDIIKTNINFNNCPDNYYELKNEAKYLAGISQYAFMLMAQRLIKIRDKKLYEKESDEKGDQKYFDFKDFIENELDISRRTAYNYIDVFTFFGDRVQALAHEKKLQFSKLIPCVSLINSKNIDEKITNFLIEYFWNEILKGNLSFRDIQKKVAEFKLQYGIIEKKEDQLLDINYKYESKGNKIILGNKKFCEFNPEFDIETVKYFKDGIKQLSYNKANGKATKFVAIDEDDKEQEKTVKDFKRKLLEAKEKGLQLKIVVK